MKGTYHTAFLGSGFAMVTQIALMEVMSPINGAIVVVHVGVTLIHRVALSPPLTIRTSIQATWIASTLSHSLMEPSLNFN